MAGMFSENESIYRVAAVSDFCSNPMQQLPFSYQYAKQAAKQLVDFYNKMDMSELSHNCKQICKDIVDGLIKIVSQEAVKFNDLVISYEVLRNAIVLMIIIYNVYADTVECSKLVEYKTCLEYINTGKVTLGIDLGESLIAHT